MSVSRGAYESYEAGLKALGKGYAGDYFTVGSSSFYWNEINRSWVSAPEDIRTYAEEGNRGTGLSVRETREPSEVRETNEIIEEEDFSQGKESLIEVEETAHIENEDREETEARKTIEHQGDHLFNNDVRVCGKMRANHLIHPFGSSFLTKADLLNEFPTPKQGWWAFVGEVYPQDIYRCATPGVWELVKDNNGEILKLIQTSIGDYLDKYGYITDGDLSRLGYLSRVIDDMAKGHITFEQGLTALARAHFKDGAEFGKFISGFAGSGAKIDANGYGEFQGLKVNGFLEVMELIVNRLSAIEGDQLLTEADTIERIEARGDGTYDLYLHAKWDGYFTAQAEGNVLKGIYNTLAEGSGSYYTSWMRVNTVNTAMNMINVSVYGDEDVPGGKNFAPVEMMRFARWGNQTDKKRQSCLYLSSTEGRIVKLTGVTKPIIDETNYGATFGSLPEFLYKMGLPLREDQDYIYARGIVVQDFIQTDYKGRPIATIVDTGAWVDGRLYLFETKNPDSGRYETHDAWHYGCRWRCMKTGTRQEPRWNAVDWAFVEGDPAFTVEFEAVNTIFKVTAIDMPLKIVAWLHNRDITEDILDEDVEWTRYSEDADGNPRPVSDTAWAMAHAGAGKSVHITTADIDWTGGRLPKKIIFTATVALRAGAETIVKKADLPVIDIS